MVYTNDHINPDNLENIRMILRDRFSPRYIKSSTSKYKDPFVLPTQKRSDVNNNSVITIDDIENDDPHEDLQMDSVAIDNCLDNESTLQSYNSISGLPKRAIHLKIKQPWELNGEFKWLDNMKQLQIENPTIEQNEIQERNSTDRIIELQNHIATLENEINIKDQLNEGLRERWSNPSIEIGIVTANFKLQNAISIMEIKAKPESSNSSQTNSDTGDADDNNSDNVEVAQKKSSNKGKRKLCKLQPSDNSDTKSDYSTNSELEKFSESYGIDQEESICPLLWVIYYDPMFEAINNSPHPGISYTASLPTYIPSADSIDIYQLKLEYKLQGYLDDTTWITDNIP
ncbi:hypothetical protein RhiirA1_450787 [Rhizophagus irregularis]|uniref:Uncharacterized protein n=1 Tax=Rhizophagus irregularis TaxID=588596 RepID=A0A2N0SDW5_9GLOM|nr:hypothetical protein RhiirA1_450787 [Rhizophagus irregularis]